jgi:hypothetical protein
MCLVHYDAQSAPLRFLFRTYRPCQTGNGPQFSAYPVADSSTTGSCDRSPLGVSRNAATQPS